MKPQFYGRVYIRMKLHSSLTNINKSSKNLFIDEKKMKIRVLKLMTKTFTLIFLFAWASMIVGYLLGMLETPPTMFLINLLFG